MPSSGNVSSNKKWGCTGGCSEGTLAPGEPGSFIGANEFRQIGSYVRFGSLADILRCDRHVRFTPNSDRESVCPLCANSGHSAPYSITSSARSRIDCGISTPIALAVLRLTTRSNLVGCSIGKSAGFAPLAMRSK